MSETWCSKSPARRIAPIGSRQNVTVKQSVTMRTHVGTMASLTLAIVLSAPSHGVAKQLMPAQFQGVWQNMEGKDRRLQTGRLGHHRADRYAYPHQSGIRRLSRNAVPLHVDPDLEG
jgi:hypothetical protein